MHFAHLRTSDKRVSNNATADVKSWKWLFWMMVEEGDEIYSFHYRHQMKGFALDREDRPGNTRVPLVNAQHCFTRFPFACALNVVCTVLLEVWQIVVQLQCNLCNRDLERGLRLLWPLVGAPGGLVWYMRRTSCAEHRANIIGSNNRYVSPWTFLYEMGGLEAPIKLHGVLHFVAFTNFEGGRGPFQRPFCREPTCTLPFYKSNKIDDLSIESLSYRNLEPNHFVGFFQDLAFYKFF